MAHPGTSRETLTAVTRFAIEIGMVPIPIQKEQPAYVLNSLLIPLANAAQTLVRTGVASPETVDRTYMIMNRGCTTGPCGMMDVVGMKTLYNVFTHVGGAKGDEEMLANSAYIKNTFLDKGLLGVQTGRGFYTYPDPVYQAPDFLDVPDVSRAEEIARLAAPIR